MHDARKVANALIDHAREAERPITHLQVQKLVYYSHAWMLAMFGEPLIDELFEVWRYGPVVPSVYFCLSHYGRDPVTDKIPMHPNDEGRSFTTREASLIRSVYEKYGHISGFRLTAATHAEGTPWHKARRNYKTHISNKDIQKFYGKIARQQQK